MESDHCILKRTRQDTIISNAVARRIVRIVSRPEAPPIIKNNALPGRGANRFAATQWRCGRLCRRWPSRETIFAMQTIRGGCAANDVAR
jgi:hypothetical protein